MTWTISNTERVWTISNATRTWTVTTSARGPKGDPGDGSGSGGDIEIEDVEGLTDALDGKAATVHTHAQSSITDLVDDLAGKASAVHTHAQSDVTGLVTDLAGKAAAVHTHAQADVTGLVSDLSALAAADVSLASAVAGKAATVHTHAQSDVTGLVTDLAGKAATVHTHAQSDVTGLTTALADKAAVSHTHAQSEVTGLVSDLAGKAAVSHTHALSDVTGLGTGVATFLGAPSSANLASMLTDETGSGANVHANSPTLVTPNLGTPSAVVLTNATGLPASGVASGTLALARMTSSTTAGHRLRVDAAGAAIEGFFEPIDILASTTTTTTTPATLLSVSLPMAGTYLVEATFAVAVGSVTGTRTQTATINCTNLTSMVITAGVAGSAPAAASRVPITASGSAHTLGLSSNQSGWITCFGSVTVSAAATLSVDFSVSGDTGTLRGGSFLKTTRKS